MCGPKPRLFRSFHAGVSNLSEAKQCIYCKPMLPTDKLGDIEDPGEKDDVEI